MNKKEIITAINSELNSKNFPEYFSEIIIKATKKEEATKEYLAHLLNELKKQNETIKKSCG